MLCPFEKLLHKLIPNKSSSGVEMKLVLTLAVAAAVLTAVPGEALEAHQKTQLTPTHNVKNYRHGGNTKEFISSVLKHLNTVAPSSR